MNNEKQDIVPELRFPEFKNNWSIVKLKDVSTYFNGKSFEGNVQAKGNFELITLKSIDTDGNLVHSNRFINDKVPTLAKGTLVMILSEQAPGLLGMTAIIPEENKYVLNQRVAELRPNNKVESYFLSKVINSNQAYFSRLGAGMKVQNISKPNVENYEFGIPIIAEQEKIANCLSSLDEAITAETEKLDLILDHQKGLLQQLFPAEGETQPKFRFPEFKDDGDWEEITLGKLAKFRRGSFPQPYGLAKWYDDENGIPFIQVYDVDTNLKIKPKTKRRISKLAAKQSVSIEKGTVIITIQGSIGRVAITQYDAYIDRTLLLFEEFFKPIDKLFFAYVIQLLFEIEKQKAPGGIIKTITKEVLTSFNIHLPDILEQQKIALCLSSVDELIESQTQKVKALKKHKKGLMQQLFPKVNSLTI